MTLLEALHRLRDHGPIDTADGICHNAEAILYGEEGRDTFDVSQPDLCELLMPQFESWPEYSGSPAYPVAMEGWRMPSSAYWSREHHNKWEGEYGAARRRLLDHCITELESKR